MTATPDDDRRAPLLVCRGVARQFGRRRVLRDVSFEAYAGEVFALLGPNGSGKTTLLGVLSTLAEPSRGEVIYPDAAGPILRVASSVCSDMSRSSMAT